MRIVYGVHGYGRGHATRALAVVQSLAARHDVRLFACGDAYDSQRLLIGVAHRMDWSTEAQPPVPRWQAPDVQAEIR